MAEKQYWAGCRTDDVLKGRYSWGKARTNYANGTFKSDHLRHEARLRKEGWLNIQWFESEELAHAFCENMDKF